MMKKRIILLCKTILIGVIAFVVICMVLYLKDSKLYRYTKEDTYQIAVEKLFMEDKKGASTEKVYKELYILGVEKRYVVFEKNRLSSKYRIVTTLDCPKEDAEIIVTGTVSDYILFIDESGELDKVERLSSSKMEAARWSIIGYCVLFFVKQMIALGKSKE